MNIPYVWKKRIPNILTSFRLVIAPVILTFGFLGHVHIVLILTILGCLTDLFDGFLARKWEVTSQTGAKLDAVSDKVFASSLLLALVKKIPILFTLFILEMIISLLNLYFYKNLKKSETLFIGKVKTTSLFITIVISFIYAFFSKVGFLLNGFAYMTINLQVLSMIHYIIHYIQKIKLIKKPILESLPIHQELMRENKEEDTIELENLNHLLFEVKEED